MYLVTCAGKGRADLTRLVAHCNHVVESLFSEIIKGARMLSADVNPKTLHRANCVGVDRCWMTTCAENPEMTISETPQQPFRHL